MNKQIMVASKLLSELSVHYKYLCRYPTANDSGFKLIESLGNQTLNQSTNAMQWPQVQTESRVLIPPKIKSKIV